MLQKALLYSSVGKKVVMAITGLALCLFLVGHLLGNIQLFWNQPQFNRYAHFLTVEMGPLTILIEACLLAVFFLHIADALLLLRTNYASRPTGYTYKKWARAKSPRTRKTVSSTFMMWSGTAILLFVGLHVWEMKYHHAFVSTPPMDQPGTPMPFTAGGQIVVSRPPYDLAMLVKNEFHNPLVAGAYIVMMVILGLHLFHAFSSAFASLGANHPRYTRGIVWLGRIFTVVICGAFACLPLFIFLGIVK